MCKLSDQFFAAVRTLSSDQPIKQRLSSAYSEHLANLSCEQLPKQSRRAFSDLQIALNTVKPLPGETAAAASARKMSSRDASRYADSIVKLFGDLVKTKATGEQLTLVEQFITENENPGHTSSQSEPHEPGVQRLS